MAKWKGGSKYERALRDLAQKLGPKLHLRVGFLENAKYPDGTSVAMIAAIQEFGAPRRGIPPRPFFRNMIAAKKPEWPHAIKELLRDTDFDVGATLRKTGEAIQGQLQESIRDTDQPPLSQTTLMLRKMFPVTSGGPRSYKDVIEARARVQRGENVGGVSTKPLIWTGEMYASVSFEVDTA